MADNRDELDLLPLDFPDDNDTEAVADEKQQIQDVDEAVTEELETSEALPEESPESVSVDVKQEEAEENKAEEKTDKKTSQPDKKTDKKPEKSKKVPPPAKKVKTKVLPLQSSFLPGQILQEGRFRSDLSIEQVAQETKINKKYIIALENGDSENLPPGIYVEAYIKQLCKIYSLEHTQVLDALHRDGVVSNRKKVPGELLHDIEKGKQVNFQEEVRVRKFFKIVGAVIIVVILAVWLILKFSSPASPAAVAETANGGENAESQKPAPEVQPEKSISSKELEVFLAPQIFTMTELKVPK